MDNPEQQPSMGEKYVAASKAHNQLIEEIGMTPATEFTESNAVNVASTLLARAVEREYLETHTYAAGVEEHREPNQDDTGFYDEKRRLTFDLQEKLARAKEGEFKGLRSFIISEAQAYNSLGNTSERFKSASANLERIAQIIPDSGDKSKVYIPSPAWMEEPAPLKIQLDMLKQGGEQAA